MNEVSIAISFVALVASIYATIKTISFNKKQTEFGEANARLNKYLLEKAMAEEKEKLKAHINAVVIEYDGYKRLELLNQGNSKAENVKFECVDTGDVFSPYEIESTFPYEDLHPGQSLKVDMHIHANSPEKVQIKIQWDDGFSKNQEKVFSLRVF